MSGCVIRQAELLVLWGVLTLCDALKLVKFSFFFFPSNLLVADVLYW